MSKLKILKEYMHFILVKIKFIIHILLLMKTIDIQYMNSSRFFYFFPVVKLKLYSILPISFGTIDSKSQ